MDRGLPFRVFWTCRNYIFSLWSAPRWECDFREGRFDHWGILWPEGRSPCSCSQQTPKIGFLQAESTQFLQAERRPHRESTCLPVEAVTPRKVCGHRAAPSPHVVLRCRATWC
jgi:hypothetical protein